jgi:hypothetical protein
VLPAPSIRLNGNSGNRAVFHGAEPSDETKQPGCV